MSQGFSVAASYVGGYFVQDLAKELGKSASTVASYLKKHLPATLLKLKNSNNRLANFCTADGVAGLRAHYTPTLVQDNNPLLQELERLRDENKRLRALITKDENATIEDLEKTAVAFYNKQQASKSTVNTSEVLAESEAVCEEMQKFIDEYNDTLTQQWRDSHVFNRRTDRTDRNTRDGKREAFASSSKVISFKRPDDKDR